MNCLFFLLTAFLIVSCGKSVQDKDDPQIPEEENTDGTYSTFLLPTDNNVSSRVSGIVKVSKYGDDFRVEISVKDAPPGIHKQYLHTGSSCKNPGEKLVPFDDDLSGQDRGSRYFPSGNYHYKRSTSYFLMLSDLHLPDDNYNDGMAKLPSWDLPLEKRAVVIYSRSSYGDVPTACGLLTRIGTSDSDETWNEPARTSSRRPQPTHVEPRPRPRPHPSPAPAPDIHPDENNNSNWWQRMWDRLRRWRDRVITGLDSQ